MIIYLNVPYSQKDQAKSLGARWNPVRKQWYVENVEHIELFQAWFPDNQKLKKPTLPKQTTKTNFVIRPYDDFGYPPWEHGPMDELENGLPIKTLKLSDLELIYSCPF